MKIKTIISIAAVSTIATAGVVAAVSVPVANKIKIDKEVKQSLYANPNSQLINLDIGTLTSIKDILIQVINANPNETMQNINKMILNEINTKVPVVQNKLSVFAHYLTDNFPGKKQINVEIAFIVEVALPQNNTSGFSAKANNPNAIVGTFDTNINSVAYSDLYFNYSDPEHRFLKSLTDTGIKTKNLIIPNSVEQVEATVFNNQNVIESIDFSQSRITNIKANSFVGSPSIKTIILPNSLSQLEANAFNGLTNLQKMNWPQNIQWQTLRDAAGDANYLVAEERNNDVYWDLDDCNRQGKGVKQVIFIPNFFEGLGQVGNSSRAPFQRDPSKVYNVVFQTGSKLNSIGKNVFYGLPNIQEINLPGTLTTLASNAINRLPQLKVLKSENNFANLSSLSGGNFSSLPLLKEIDISNASGITSLGGAQAGSFSDNALLEKIVLPNTLSTIVSRIFHNLPSLKYMNKPAALDVNTGTTSWGGLNVSQTDKPFYRTPIYLKIFNNKKPNPIITAADFSEYDRSNTNVMWIGNGFTTIGEDNPQSTTSGISDFSYLSHIYLPETLTTIGINGFVNLYALNTIDLPKSLTTIRANGFNSVYLTNITLLPTIKTIEAKAFSSLYLLDTITFAPGYPDNIQTATGYSYNADMLFETPSIASKAQLINPPQGLVINFNK